MVATTNSAYLEVPRDQNIEVIIKAKTSESSVAVVEKRYWMPRPKTIATAVINIDLKTLAE
jgi:hypothetical protein